MLNKTDFVIAPETYMREKGVYTNDLRHSVDGSNLVVAHIGYVLPQIPNIETDPNCDIFFFGSEEIMNIMSTSVWSTPIEEIIDGGVE